MSVHRNQNKMVNHDFKFLYFHVLRLFLELFNSPRCGLVQCVALEPWRATTMISKLPQSGKLVFLSNRAFLSKSDWNLQQTDLLLVCCAR